MEHLSVFFSFLDFFERRGSKYIFRVLFLLQAAFSKAVHRALMYAITKETKEEVMISSVAVEGIECGCEEIMKGGKTAGPLELQSTVSLS